MKKYRDHMCFACFKRCTDKKCNANHRCTHCGGDYIYFCDELARQTWEKFLKWKKRFDALQEAENAKKKKKKRKKRRKYVTKS